MVPGARGVIWLLGEVAEFATLGRLLRMSQTENTELHVIAERVVEQAVRRAKTRRRQR
jgi:hypothetical protein